MPDPIYFGHPKTAFLYCLFTWILFLGLGIGLYWFLTRENSLRKEFESAFHGRNLQIRKGKAALWIGIPVVLLMAWYYHANLFVRFFAIQSDSKDPNGIEEWLILYHYPDRTISIKVDSIKGWHSQVDWAQRGPRRSLVLVLTNGTALRSSAWNDFSHNESLEQLKSTGVEVDVH